MKLSDIATFVEDKISSNSISLADYVTTDSLLPNKEGKNFATNLPPVVCSLTHYREGDVLVANIRPVPCCLCQIQRIAVRESLCLHDSSLPVLQHAYQWKPTNLL